MNIRQITIAELPLCLPFGQAFMTEKQLPDQFSEETFLNNWTAYLTRYNGVILGLWDEARLVGGIGGIVCPDVYTGVPSLTEMFWYVDESCRRTLLAARLQCRFRAWGKERGAQRFRMIHMLEPGETPSTVKLAGFYERMGLRPIEVGFDGPI
mgnify:CR=1 FL=1